MDESMDRQSRRLRKAERREQILHELRMRPHVRISEMAERFGVSTETVRRDMDRLSKDGLISRAHGGASSRLHYPDFHQRSLNRRAEREAIGRRAARMIGPGESVMIDSGSTTAQLARFLAFSATPCTVITNSLTVAMTLGQNENAEIILCPGDFLPSEAAVVGTDTVDFLRRHKVDHCMIGASGLTGEGMSETIRGFAAVKRAMIESSDRAHLLIDSEKFGRRGLAQVARTDELTSVITDKPPQDTMARALSRAGMEVIATLQNNDRSKSRATATPTERAHAPHN